MKILISPDSFKNSISAKIAAESIYKGAVKIIPNLDATLIPLSDGGEGFTEAIINVTGGNYKEVSTHDALMRKMKACIGILADGSTAIIELAAAAGIEHLKEEELNPLITSTYGVGELMKHALDLNCKKIILGLGGSATNDAGVGLAQALGVKFFDNRNSEIGYGGGELSKIQHIDTAKLDKRLKNIEIVVACDVTNVLYGKEGASLVFGPQKGASNQTALILDKNLKHYSNLLFSFYGINVGKIPGSGAAGGTTASLLAFCNAKLTPGFELVKKITHLEEIISSCDLVITGEGKIDFQTAFGKAPGSLAKLASVYNVPVVAFAGILGEGYENLYNEGFNEIISINNSSMPLDVALKNGPLLLECASERYFNELKGKNQHISVT